MKFAALLVVILLSLVNMLNEKGFDFVTMRSKGCRNCVELKRDETQGVAKNDNEKALIKMLELLLPELQETLRDYFSSSYIHLPNPLSQCPMQSSPPSLSDYLSSDLAAYLSSPTPQNQLSFLLTTIPYLETHLRLIYVVVNNITGEKWRTSHQGFFVLLEDIMQQCIIEDDEKKEYANQGGERCRKKNKIVEVIGPGAANLIYDIFLHPAGPRLRDRLSHGEFSLLYTSTIVSLGDAQQFHINNSIHRPESLRFTASFSREIVYLIIYLHSVFNFNRAFVTTLNENRMQPDPQRSLAPSVEAEIQLNNIHNSISQIPGNDMQKLASTVGTYMSTYKSKYHPLSLLYGAVCKMDDMLDILKEVIDTSQNDMAAIGDAWHEKIESRSQTDLILGSLGKLIDRHEVADWDMKRLRLIEPRSTLYRDDNFIKVIMLWIAIVNSMNGTVEMVW
ncbi:hypothetical protein BKA69DRAFT_1068359 [Paraphysoderma sedebokerense]|nr:hypothetical protein BKA69DRAFT_1068359 [Paraphysoderma sedebokerense]